MGSAVVSAGTDSWVSQNFPTRNYGSDRYLAIRSTSLGAGPSGGGVGLIYFRSPVPAGATVTSAVIEIRTWGGSPAESQTMSLRRVTEAWSQSKVTFNTYPSYNAEASASAVIPASSPGFTLLSFDVTSAFQAYANGTKNYGFRIDTTATAGVTRLRGFGADVKPVLRVTWSDAPKAPVNLRPNGVISLDKPTLSFDHVDVAGDKTIQAVQFQLDATGDFGSPDFDSGAVLTDAAELDLSQDMNRSASITTTAASTTITAPTTFTSSDVGAAVTGTGIPDGATITAVASGTSATISAAATASGTVTATIGRRYPGLADGATVYYRARVQDGAGLWSAWSDDAAMTRQPQTSVTILSPTEAGGITEPTPPVMWSATDQTSWRLFVFDSAGKTVHDTGYRNGADDGYTLPSGVLRDGGTYSIHVYVRDSVATRVTAPGDPIYVSDTVTATVTVDPTTDAPTGLAVVQAGSEPTVDLTWSRAVLPDEMVVLANGVVVAQAAASEWTTDGINYSYSYEGARPNVPTTYAVRAVVNGKQSPNSGTVSFTSRTEGIWLIGASTSVALMGDDEGSWSMPDNATIYEPHGGKSVTRVVDGMRGWEGQLSGYIFDGFNGSYTELQAALTEMKNDPANPVRLIAGDANFRALIGDITWWPTPVQRDGQLHRKVSFSFWQVDDFEF